MYKKEEMAKLDEFIADMPDTYIGDWLSEQRVDIENAMASDSMAWVDTLQEYRQKAINDAQMIIEKAERKAAEIIRLAEGREISSKKLYQNYSDKIHDLGRTLERVARDM